MAKTKISITIDDELVRWLDIQIRKKKFANRSHGIEYAVSEIKENQ